MRLEPSWRQPAGILLILVWIAAWSVAAVSASTLIAGAHEAVHALYYLVAGIAWILPLKPLLRWMQTGRWRNGASDGT